ncbi:hypothetical protein P3T36_000629 [Kitasatospora sp. MAP12-15]|uniref:hypothetical protein n=1 Tax=unclassified Kitasatospora TaxID=2633591 RepID=UPI0024757883|nr:hypothetical protein [Kitasatospora sp. MAP12-44]MDH6114228.1 hypothetical protein [Kitasatospora sp. MAP12-44]
MKRMPPDPDRLAQYQQLMRELATNPPYPVYGLTRPTVALGHLARWESENGVPVAVQLAYGDWREAGEPFVGVTTGPPGSAEQRVDPLLALRREIRNEKLPRSPSAPVRAQLPQGELCRVGEAWALRMAVAGQAVTVIGRGVAPEDVEVGPVDALLPYVERRNELFERITTERRVRPEPVLAPASGVAAVRAFLETFVPGGPDAGTAYRALSRRAVTELAAVLGCGSERAEYLVYSMVNQISQLRSQVPWFTERDGPRAAAVEELVRYIGLRQPVDSEAAQACWERYWAAQQTLADSHAQDLLEAWVSAWVAWDVERGR